MASYSERGSHGADPYRTRLAPSPSGFLHLGHARTFYHTWKMARDQGGQIVLRIEDIDMQRSRREYEEAVYEDLIWLGLDWDEGPNSGGPHAPYRQSERFPFYRGAWEKLRDAGVIYPSAVSRRQIEAYASRKEADGMTTLFPEELRPEGRPLNGSETENMQPDGLNWRFRVPDGEEITFEDGRCGHCSYTAGVDFGDFLVWRREDAPSYELAVVVDDHAMGINQVIRGEDLLLSTARQILLYRELCYKLPFFYHLKLVCDAQGKRLSKTDRSTSLREIRARGCKVEDLRTADFDKAIIGFK